MPSFLRDVASLRVVSVLAKNETRVGKSSKSMGKLVRRDISCFILVPHEKVQKLFLNWKDEVLIKVLVELGGSPSFFPPKAAIL